MKSTLPVLVLLTACTFAREVVDDEGNYSRLFPKTPLSDAPCIEDQDCVVAPLKDRLLSRPRPRREEPLLERPVRQAGGSPGADMRRARGQLHLPRGRATQPHRDGLPRCVRREPMRGQGSPCGGSGIGCRTASTVHGAHTRGGRAEHAGPGSPHPNSSVSATTIDSPSGGPCGSVSVSVLDRRRRLRCRNLLRFSAEHAGIRGQGPSKPHRHGRWPGVLHGTPGMAAVRRHGHRGPGPLHGRRTP